MLERPPFSALENAEAESWADIQQHVTPAFRDRVDLRVQRIGGAIAIFAPKEDMAALNRVWLPGEASAVSPRALVEIVDHARSLGERRFVAHCPTWAAEPDLMSAHGFRRRPPMMKLARRPSFDVPETAFRVEQIGPDAAELFGRVAAQGYDLEPWMSDGFNSTVGLPGWNHYIVFDDRTPIATAALRIDGGYAWCCLAATLAAHRGRGAQLSLLYRRIRDAAKAGCEWIISEALPDAISLRNQQRAGFEVIYERPNYLAELKS